MKQQSNADQKHIVMVNKGYPPWMGGIERHVCDISEALVARGWRVTALVCNDCYQQIDETCNGVEVVRLPQITSLFSQPIVKGFQRTLLNLKPDLIHVHVPYPLGWFIPRSIQAPVLCTWHSDIIRQSAMMPMLRLFQNRFLKRCEQIIVTSENLRQASKELRLFKHKCSVIPLALPEESVDEAKISSHCREIQETWRGKRLLFVGRLVSYKGLSYLLEAMKQVDAHLLIVGDGPLNASLREEAEPVSNIHFLGYADEGYKRALYRSADLFVLPSITNNEAFGYVLLEALREGLPLVTCQLPTGVSYVNQDGKTGLAVPPRDSNALAQSINTILKDESQRNQMSRSASEWYHAEFQFSKTIDCLEAHYLKTFC